MLNLKKESFLHLPTPLEKLEKISKDLNVNFYIKRDDLTGLGGGGNKLRKLEFFIRDALDKKATMLITVGGAQTNHGRLTAAVAAKYGFKCAIVTEDTYPGEISSNILLDGIMGAEVFYESKPEPIIKQFEALGEKVYFIPMGGSSPLGVLGYYNASLELYEQAKALNILDSRIVVAVGSMGTYMGLCTGIANQKLPFRLTGIAIAPYENGASEFAKKYFNKIKAFHNLDCTCSNFDIKDDYTYGDYNNAVDEVRKAIYYMARNEAIILDPCYTGKAFNGICKMIKSSEIKKGENIIFIHTGGFPGIYGENHRVEFEKELLINNHLI